LARTIYIRGIYGIFGREITKYTVIYGVYIRFWPTLKRGAASLQTDMHLNRIKIACVCVCVCVCNGIVKRRTLSA